MNIWLKDNKVIKDIDGNVVACQQCPCNDNNPNHYESDYIYDEQQYYAIIGFRYRSTAVDGNGQLYDKCTYRYKIEVKKVIDNKILVQWTSQFPSYGHPEYYIRYMQINRKLGFCGSTIISSRGSTYTIQAYNISNKIYKNLNEFEQYFYSGCNIQPNGIIYPDIWRLQTYGDNECWRMESNAYTCIDNYWTKVFTDKYIPSFNLTFTCLCQDWNIHLQAVRYHWLDSCFCYDSQGNMCDYISPWQPPRDCIGDDCTNKQCSPTDHDYVQAIGQHMYKAPADWFDDDTIWFDLVPGGPEYQYEDMIPCWDINSIGTTTNINNVLYNKIRDKDQYIWWQSYSNYHDWPGYDSYSSYIVNVNCELSSDLCLKSNYWSGLVRWHQENGNRWEYLFRWGKLDLKKNSYTPDNAIGIKFGFKITKKILYYPNSDLNNVDVSEDLYDDDINLYFDQIYNDLPLITDIPMPNIVQKPTCSDDNCQNCSGYLNISPFTIEEDTEKHVTHPNAWIKQQGIYFQLIAKQYVF